MQFKISIKLTLKNHDLRNYIYQATRNLVKGLGMGVLQNYIDQGCRNHGCSGCKCTPCLLHFQLCGCSAGADYGCNGCTKLLQQTELNVAPGCVWGCSTPSRQEFGKVVTIWRKEKRKALLMEFLARNYGEIVAK
jgi:hypothetical protein